MTTTAWHADPLNWGNGPRIFEAFLEPTCPYSVRAFNKFDQLLSQAGEDKITVKIRLQPQPWHMYSGVLVRCIIAASTLEGGKETAKQVMAAIAAHREEFEFERHAGGPNMDVTPNQIVERLETLQRRQAEGSLRTSGSRSGDQMALQICPPERHPCLANLHDRRAGAARHEQRRRSWSLGEEGAGQLTLAVCQRLSR